MRPTCKGVETHFVRVANDVNILLRDVDHRKGNSHHFAGRTHFVILPKLKTRAAATTEVTAGAHVSPSIEPSGKSIADHISHWVRRIPKVCDLISVPGRRKRSAVLEKISLVERSSFSSRCSSSGKYCGSLAGCAPPAPMPSTNVFTNFDNIV